jgi:hypothetical protein
VSGDAGSKYVTFVLECNSPPSAGVVYIFQRLLLWRGQVAIYIAVELLVDDHTPLRYQVLPCLTGDEGIRHGVDASMAFVMASSESPGASVYGVNTGVGGSGEFPPAPYERSPLTTLIT